MNSISQYHHHFQATVCPIKVLGSNKTSPADEVKGTGSRLTFGWLRGIKSCVIYIYTCNYIYVYRKMQHPSPPTPPKKKSPPSGSLMLFLLDRNANDPPIIRSSLRHGMSSVLTLVTTGSSDFSCQVTPTPKNTKTTAGKSHLGWKSLAKTNIPLHHQWLEMKVAYCGWLSRLTTHHMGSIHHWCLHPLGKNSSQTCLAIFFTNELPVHRMDLCYNGFNWNWFDQPYVRYHANHRPHRWSSLHVPMFQLQRPSNYLPEKCFIVDDYHGPSTCPWRRPLTRIKGISNAISETMAGEIDPLFFQPPRR